MKTRNLLRQYAPKIGAAVVITAATATQALADAAAATSKITASEGDISTLGWAALGLVIVAAAFKYMRRAI